MLGGFTRDMLEDIDSAQSGVWGIDILDENITRFQRPCYGDLLKNVKSVHVAENRESYYELLERRGHSADRLITILERNLRDKQGDSDIIRHWLIGLRMSRLKACQSITMLDTFTGHVAIESLKPCIDETETLMEDFIQLWKDSVTTLSLSREVDVKFKRDIRVMQGLTTR